MEGQSGLSELLWVSAVERCMLSRITLYHLFPHVHTHTHTHTHTNSVPNSWVPYSDFQETRVVSFHELSQLKLAALASDCFSYNKLQNRKNKRKPWLLVFSDFVCVEQFYLPHVCSNPSVTSKRDMCLVEEKASASCVSYAGLTHLLFSSLYHAWLHPNCNLLTQRSMMTLCILVFMLLHLTL